VQHFINAKDVPDGTSQVPVDPSSYSLTPWPFSGPHSTQWLFIDPLGGQIDPWGLISTTLRTTGLKSLIIQ